MLFMLHLENPVSLRVRIVKASCAGLKEVVGAQGRGAAWAPPQELTSLSILGCTGAVLLPWLEMGLLSLLTSRGMQWDMLVSGITECSLSAVQSFGTPPSISQLPLLLSCG